MIIMATPQWVLLQRHLEPTEKSSESRFERNARKRQREAVRSAVRKGFLKHLDQKMILESVSHFDIKDLDQVKYMSFPSCSIKSIDELAMLSSSQLRVVNLPYNYISSLDPFRSCVNLIKLDVSGNQIHDLPDSSFWSSLPALKVLYLNNNSIMSKESLLNLCSCKTLQVLTMYDNPVSLLNNYRHIAVNCIVSLKALDHHVISDQEIIENLHLSGKFRPRAKPFHRPLYQPVDKDDTISDELAKINHLLLSIDKVLAHYSPVVIIQRWVRGWLTRKRLLRSTNQQIRSLVQHRQRTSEQVNKILKEASRVHIPFKKQLGSQRTSNIPNPPPCTPAVTNRLQSAMLEKQMKSLTPKEKELKKAVRETKELLKDGSRLQKGMKKKKKRTRHGKEKPRATGSNEMELGVCGEQRDIGTIDKVTNMKERRVKDGVEVRLAETDINNIVVQMKQPVPVEPKTKPWAKDSHAFSRAQMTMSLSLLKDINREQELLRKKNEQLKNAKIVARVREERVKRREKIQESQMVVREAVMIWKITEERRMRECKEKMEMEQEMNRMRRARSLEMMTEAVKNRKEGEEFASVFRQQHTMLDKVLAKEERKLLTKSLQESTKERVQQDRALALEQSELVKQFMKMREEKLRSESIDAREKLNAQMIKVASEQLMEAKQKVAKVRAWKNATKNIDEDQGTNQLVPNSLDKTLNSIPEAETADLGLLGPLLKAYNSARSKDGYSPHHMRGTTHESHRTWQRGSHVLQEVSDSHLPKLPSHSDHCPLMYDGLHPLPYFHNVGTTPDNSYWTSLINGTLGDNAPVVHPPGNLHLMMKGESQLMQDKINLLVK